MSNSINLLRHFLEKHLACENNQLLRRGGVECPLRSWQISCMQILKDNVDDPAMT